jgi:phage-related protein
MRDYITWKGINSRTVGITVTELPEIILPEERVTFTDIPGLSGSLTQTEGTDVYKDITLAVKCYLSSPTPQAVQAIAGFFRGSGRLELPSRPDGYYEARVVNQIQFAKILRGNTPRTFTVNFRCKPLLRLYSGETEQEVTSGSFLLNPTGVQANPLITVTGSGDITLLVGTRIIQLTGIENGITLDSELQEAYYGNELKNTQMTGEFPVLGAGNTAVSWTGGSVTSVSVTPRWVSL